MGDAVSAQRRRALDRVDDMAPDLRAAVHEMGLPIVEAFLAIGVRDPRHMRHIARLFWTAANGQQNSTAGIRSHLDVMLMRAGGAPNSATLGRMLQAESLVIVPRSPSHRMVQASLEEHHRHGHLTRDRKHLLRLQAALTAGAHEFWPDIFPA